EDPTSAARPARRGRRALRLPGLRGRRLPQWTGLCDRRRRDRRRAGQPLTVTNLIGGPLLLATKDEVFDGVGKTVFPVALCNVRGLGPDFVCRIAHGDAYAALAKHQDIGWHIANGGNLLRGNVQDRKSVV